MATIEVNHDELRELAEEISEFSTNMAKQMDAANTTVNQLLAGDWIGADAIEFNTMWQDVDSANSTYGKFKTSMKGYGEAIAACADVYQTVQEDVYNEANRLPKYCTW